MKSIETSYNGYRFRSRLEARAAVFLDAAKIPYSYEPEGFVFDDGTTYLPDFYLPDQDTFLECKGVMNDKDEHKIDQLSKETDKEIVIVNSDMSIDLAEHVDNLHDFFPFEEEKEGLYIAQAVLLKCLRCKKKYLSFLNGSWDCKYCGYHHEDFETVEAYYISDPDYDYEPINKAKRARFEFGEVGGR